MNDKAVVDLNWLCNWLEENSSGIYRPAREAAHVIRSMSSELESLRAQLKAKDAALEAIAFATAPNPDDGSHHENAYVLATEAMVAPIPVQQSPAVVVPDNKCKMCNGHGLIGGWIGDGFDSDLCPSCNPSPRITEQDAREILNAYWASNADDDDWIATEEGRALLDKLNGKGE